MTWISRVIAERGAGVDAQALRHRGDAIGLVDAERDGLGVRRVAADSVISVPCSVVMIFGTRSVGCAAMICRAR